MSRQNLTFSKCTIDTNKFLIVFLLLTYIANVHSAAIGDPFVFIANITATLSTGEVKHYDGLHCIECPTDTVTGRLVDVDAGNNHHKGCSYPYPDFVERSEDWIALVERGDCAFRQKLAIATEQYNASAVIFYNNVAYEETMTIMDMGDVNTTAINVKLQTGLALKNLTRDNHQVTATITNSREKHHIKPTEEAEDTESTSWLTPINIIVVVVMIISLVVVVVAVLLCKRGIIVIRSVSKPEDEN